MTEIKGMRPYPVSGSAEYILEQIAAQRPNDMRVIAALQQNKRGGRNRTGIRAIPTAHNDVLPDDLLGDFVNDATHFYLLVSDSGTLKWHKDTLAIAW